MGEEKDKKHNHQEGEGEGDGERESVASDTPLFQLLSSLLQQVESLSNQEEVQLRAKIEALGSEITKVPSTSQDRLHPQLDEMAIASELDKLSARLENVEQMICSDPQVQSLLSSTADVWLPVITANADQRRNFNGSIQHPHPHPHDDSDDADPPA